jgi:DNA polymerase-1
MYPEYKGTRSETPQLVIDSLEPLCGLCKAMGFPVLMIKGFEADDIIGSMAKRAEKEGFEVYMVTPDKDYGQLISPDITQYKPGKAGSDIELIDVQKICDKYGIQKPEQVVEILTICGDASDNVPGVKGVGEVGAGKLIAKYGTVKNIYAHIDELTPKQKEAFANAEGHIWLSHDLVTIKTDIEIPVDSREMKLRGEYSQEAAELFEHYEFGSLKRFLGDIQPASTTDEKKLEFQETSPEKAVMAARKEGRIAIIAEGEQPGMFTSISRITVSVIEDGRCLVSEGKADDFREIITKVLHYTHIWFICPYDNEHDLALVVRA